CRQRLDQAPSRPAGAAGGSRRGDLHADALYRRHPRHGRACRTPVEGPRPCHRGRRRTRPRHAVGDPPHPGAGVVADQDRALGAGAVGPGSGDTLRGVGPDDTGQFRVYGWSARKATMVDTIPSPKLRDRRILLIVSGGIAAYKALELVRLLRKGGAGVRVVMTATAERFVTPLAFGAIAGGRVFTDLFDRAAEHDIGHIRLAREADLVLAAPATA